MKIVSYSSSRKAHKNCEPTMTQVIPQLSLETIFRDYCRGVLHPELSHSGVFDPEGVDDDNFDFVQEVEDISELVEPEIPTVPKEAPEEKPLETPSPVEDTPTTS